MSELTTGMTRVRTLLLTTAVLLSVAGLGASAAAVRADPFYGGPTVGECHDYSYKTLFNASDPSAPVSCDGAHTAITLAVVKVPRRVKLTADNAFESFGPKCERALHRALGAKPTTRAISAFTVDWFAPTKAQQGHGAHWARCDLILWGGGKLRPLPSTLTLGSPPLDDAVARCIVVHTKEQQYTTCDHRHSFRSEGGVQLGGAYKSHDAYSALAARRCPGIAGRNWLAIWPSVQQWHEGLDRVLVCYEKTDS